MGDLRSLNSREERILMATQKEICAANSASCEELTHFVNSLNEKQLGTAMPAGWTVSGVLCHLVYWDFHAITLLKQWQSTGITPTPNDFDLVNEAMRPLLLAIEPQKAVSLVIDYAQQIDSLIESLPESFFNSVQETGKTIILNRGIHRHTHISEIKAVLGFEATEIARDSHLEP
jgi:hypothetical protein